MDDRPESVDLEAVRRDQPVEYAGRVQKLGFREGLLVAGGLIVILAGAGVVAIGAPGPRASASPSASALAVVAPSASPAIEPSVGPSPTPAPTPAVTPGGTCLPPPTTDPPFVALFAGGNRYVGEQAGTTWRNAPPTPDAEWGSTAATVPLGQGIVLSVGYTACALEWQISVDGRTLQVQHNPGMDPAFASQGYFQVTLPATTRQRAALRVDLHFVRGWTSSAWNLALDPSPIPQAFVVAGSTFVAASPGCGFNIRLYSGGSAQEACTTSLPKRTETLFAAPRTLIAFRTSHATFSGPEAAPGHELPCSQPGANPDDQTDPACDAVITAVPTEDFAFFAPSTAGIWLVEISGCASQAAADVACGAWYVTIDTRDADPTESPTSG